MLKVAFSLLLNINQSACSALDWVLNNQSEFYWMLYKHHWEFPIHKKIITMYILENIFCRTMHHIVLITVHAVVIRLLVFARSYGVALLWEKGRELHQQRLFISSPYQHPSIPCRMQDIYFIHSPVFMFRLISFKLLRLINYGPMSLKILKLLLKPWTYNNSIATLL